jgi:hypothetical protein
MLGQQLGHYRILERIGAGGVVRLKGTGYDATEKWEASMQDAIEKVKPAAPAPSSNAAAK